MAGNSVLQRVVEKWILCQGIWCLAVSTTSTSNHTRQGKTRELAIFRLCRLNWRYKCSLSSLDSNWLYQCTLITAPWRDNLSDNKALLLHCYFQTWVTIQEDKGTCCDWHFMFKIWLVSRQIEASFLRCSAPTRLVSNKVGWVEYNADGMLIGCMNISCVTLSSLKTWTKACHWCTSQ